MRALATLLCLFMAAPHANPERAREARQAEWAEALQGAATPPGGKARDLPQPLRDALRRWTREAAAESDDA